MNKHRLVYAVLIAGVILVVHFILMKISPNSLPETLAQESKPEKKVDKENIKIEQFCLALKNRNLIKYRECFYLAWNESDSEDDMHYDFFSKEANMYMLMNGEMNDYDTELTDIKIINYLYVVDKAGIYGRASIHIDFKCTNKNEDKEEDKVYQAEFTLDLKKYKGEWLAFSQTQRPDSITYEIYETIVEAIDDEDSDDDWDDNDDND